MKASVKILSILVAGALLALTLIGQSGQGVVTGKVLGRDGMPLQNAVVFVERMNSQSALTRTVAQRFDTKTGKNGGYSVTGLPPGSYQVSVIENNQRVMILGDQPGNVITVSDGREATANFDLTKAPPPAVAAGAGPPPSADDVAKDRAAIEAADKLKKDRDKAFAAGTAAYKAGAAAEPTAKDEAAKAAVVAFFEEAAKQFQIVTVADPKQDVAFANLGNSFNKIKKFDEAAAAYQKAVELKPKESAYYNNLGLALGGAKKLDAAKAAFDSAAAMDPARAGEYLFNEGAMYNNAGDYPNAIDAFKRTLIADPNHKGAMLQQAISYFGSPDTMAQAEPLLKKLLTLNPTAIERDTANGFLEALHTTGPTEFKSDAAIAAEKKAADAAAAKAAKDAKTPPPAAAGRNKG